MPFAIDHSFVHLYGPFICCLSIVFERSTGWRLNSEYELLPEHIQSYMEAFYAPFNALLFRLLDDVGGTAGDNSKGRVMDSEWG